MKVFLTPVSQYFYDATENTNTDEPLIPELWSQETLALLEENMVLGNLVHRDFENEFARFGEIVNTRRVNDFDIKRKIDGESTANQDAGVENIPVALNQHVYIKFTIHDEELTKSMTDLIRLHLAPAALGMARGIDRIIGGRLAQFAISEQIAGKLGTAPDKSTLLAARNVLNKRAVPSNDRAMLLTPDSETDLLELEAFTKVNEAGTNTALIEALLGRKFQWNTYMGQNTPYVTIGTDIASTTLTAADAAGATVISVTAATSMTVGAFLTVAGDMTPQMITAISTLDITIYPGLKSAVSNGAAVTTYVAYAVNQATTSTAAGGTASVAGYRAGWHKEIIFDGGTKVPEVGTIVTFGIAANTADLAAALAKYIVIQATSTTILLDRPLEVAIANDAKVNFGPIGQYNFGFRRNALALVCRPLLLPRTRVISGSASYNGLSLRTMIDYDSDVQAHKVTIDCLLGTAVLEENAGIVMLG
jgi:hypothetical protein